MLRFDSTPNVHVTVVSGTRIMGVGFLSNSLSPQMLALDPLHRSHLMRPASLPAFTYGRLSKGPRGWMGRGHTLFKGRASADPVKRGDYLRILGAQGCGPAHLHNTLLSFSRIISPGPRLDGINLEYHLAVLVGALLPV